jgi:hypothetical protein
MKRPFKRLLVFCLLLLLVPSWGVADAVAQKRPRELSDAVAEAKNAGVPQHIVNDLLALGYEKKFDQAPMSAMIAVLTLAHTEGIPVQPLASKIEEGILKGVSAPVIERTVRRKLEDYRAIRSLLEAFLKKHGQQVSIPPEYLVRLTECLYCGLTREEVERVIETAPRASVPVLTRGVEVFASLKQMKFDPKLSEQIVFTGIKQSFFSAEQRDFARAMAAAKRKGMPDAKIAAVAVEGMESGSTSDRLSSNLGLSSRDMAGHGPQVGASHSGAGHGSASGGHGSGHGGAHGGGHGGSDSSGGGHGGGHGGGSGGGDGGGGGGGGGCN